MSTITDSFGLTDALPDTLPDDPFPTFKHWFDLAKEHKITDNPDAFSLATASPTGVPSLRIVLCRKINLEEGHITFFTNRNSAKGRQIAANPNVAATFHFDAFNKVVRMEGIAVESPDWESDEYFNGRHPAKRLAAWSSDQSEPIESRDALLEKISSTMGRFNVTLDDIADTPEARERAAELIPRPPHWGGYRIWPRAVELWVGNDARVHDRARYERTITEVVGDGAVVSFDSSGWDSRRLQP